MGLEEIGGLALLALLFGGGGSKKKSNGGTPPEDEIIPIPDDDDGADDDDIILVPDGPINPQNVGYMPAKWLVPMATAESATQGTLPGLARVMMVKAWQARRAGQGLLSPAEAAAFAAANPNLCLNCHNTSSAERLQSCKAIERVTLPKGTKGPCGGVGAYSDPWPVSPQNAAWKDFGSAGLFDILASNVLYAGIHEGFTPALNLPPTICFDPRVQMYTMGVMVYRIAKGQYKVLTDSPRETWTRIMRVYGSGSLKDTADNIAVGTRFQNRAAELGIDLDSLSQPTLETLGNWPGAQAFSDGLASIQVA